MCIRDRSTEAPWEGKHEIDAETFVGPTTRSPATLPDGAADCRPPAGAFAVLVDSGWVFGVDAASDDVSDFEEGAELTYHAREQEQKPGCTTRLRRLFTEFRGDLLFRRSLSFQVGRSAPTPQSLKTQVPVTPKAVPAQSSLASIAHQNPSRFLASAAVLSLAAGRRPQNFWPSTSSGGGSAALLFHARCSLPPPSSPSRSSSTIRASRAPSLQVPLFLCHSG
eukprot:3093796-Rhodomonas_salina.1